MSYFDGFAQGPININQVANFRLTEYGQKILNDHNEAVRAEGRFLADYEASRIETDGTHSMQLWQLMRVFGPACVGCKPPFENCVITITR